ncbi:MAG: glycoside hydrolase family 127 protein [Bacteroidota bacterium]|nr:glycoside hydrolase family 127 protein [Bacteroidota bacterium]
MMNKKRLIVTGIVGLLILMTHVACQIGVQNKVNDLHVPLPPHSVRLEGYLDDYIQLSIDNWNKGDLPYAEFVEFFRSGRPQFALGEMWGKAVRSGCMFYRYTPDPELKKIMDETVQDLLTTQRENGSISCVEIEGQPEESELWERKYVMLGLQGYYEWVNADPRVLDALKKQADNIISIVGPAPKVEITDVGWSATNIGHEECHIESSSLLEPFVKLYQWTGEERYLDFATYIIDAGGTKHFNIFEMALNNVEPYKMAGHYPKAYEMLSIFEGLVEYYRVTGQPEMKQMVLNLYNNVRKYEITIIGNGGSDQPYHPQVFGEAWGNTALEQSNPDITRMMETCVGVTWMKFCSQIARLTGDPAAIDEIEKYIYNGLIGAMKPSGDGFSYVNLLNGAKVTNQGWGWEFDGMPVTCCNLNGPMGLAYIPYVAVMNSAEGPVINLYNQGEADFQTPAKREGKIAIHTDYPLSGDVKIEVTLPREETFTIKVRIPEWSQESTLTVNGEPLEALPGSYAEINREWQTGDVISLSFDMRCRVVDAPRGSNRAADHYQAVIRGPLVLARDESLDPNYNQPVSLQSQDGFIEYRMVEPASEGYKLQLTLPLVNGERITVVDYASVDNWNNGMHVCTWIPYEK